MDIQHCSCGKEDCPVYMMSDTACEVMDEIRNEIIEHIRLIKPDFKVKLIEN